MYPPYGLPHRGVILHRGLFGALLCAALSLAHERPRRLVIGHVLLRGHARNSERFREQAVRATGFHRNRCAGLRSG
jgi:hypothetical protein